MSYKGLSLSNTTCYLKKDTTWPLIFETLKGAVLWGKVAFFNFMTLCPIHTHGTSTLLEKTTFYSQNGPFLRGEMAVLWGKTEDRIFWCSEGDFWDFRSASEKGGTFGCLGEVVPPGLSRLKVLLPRGFAPLRRLLIAEGHERRHPQPFRLKASGTPSRLPVRMLLKLMTQNN